MKMIHYQKYIRWITQIILLIALGLVLAICVLNFINPAFPSLRCEGTSIVDPHISHKYKGDTINIWKLFSMVLGVPFIQFLVTEWFHSEEPKNPYILKESSSRWKRCCLHAFIWYRNYFFGLSFMLLINDIAKTTVNSPRPHWIDSCKPNFTREGCHLGWVDNYECTNAEITRWRLADARKSFPSGHAALGFYSAVFMMIYQHNRMNARILGQMFVLWLHTFWFGWGVFCALSRVADHRHHPLDVSGGSLLGIFGGIASAYFLCNLFGSRKTECYQNKVVSNSNGSATILDGFPSGMNVSRHVNGDAKRPSLRRLLSTQSTMTQMSDIAEDRELDNL